MSLMRITDLIKLNLSRCFTGNAFHLGRILQQSAAEPHERTLPMRRTSGAEERRVALAEIIRANRCSWEVPLCL